MTLESNYTGTFTKQDSVTFDPLLWAATNGTINWSNYPLQIPYTEADVFHTQLTHTANGGEADVDWTIRIGKGGQIYYADIGNVGQIICPQRYMSPWNDDCMTTTVFSYDERNEDPEMGGNESFANGYIHGSGMYIKPQMDPLNNKPFYCPLLAEQFDANDRSYTIINWGLVPKPNVNRGDVLFYSKYKDLGNGVVEMIFYCYNFGNRTYTFAETPWWAVRPSKYPNMVEGINGTSQFKVTNKNFGDGAISSSGGWGAHTVNPSLPDSPTCALVWGNNTPMGINFGLVSNGERDMSLISPSYGALSLPFGTGFYYKRYAVFGKLVDVANICQNLNDDAVTKSIEFSTDYSGKLPLYFTTLEGQQVLTTTTNGSPVAYAHAIPVRNSYPLMLMKNNDSGQYFLSTDPYAACGKQPFTNPYPIGHEKYATYENRVIYQPYDGKTEWVALLGYALESTPAGLASGYQLLSDVIGTIPFVAGEKLDANNLMVPTV